MVKLGPPILNSRAIRLATIFPRLPMVRLAFRAGEMLSRSLAVQSASSVSLSCLPSLTAHPLACCGMGQRRENPVLFRS